MVRTAAVEDLTDVVRLIGEFRDWWGKDEPGDELIAATVATLLEDPAALYLLAFNDDDEAVGFAQLRFRLSVWTGVDDCWLEDVFVVESARGAGHGRGLVEAAIGAATARGCKRVELDVNLQNEAAMTLYLELGFQAEPKPPGPTLYISRPL